MAIPEAQLEVWSKQGSITQSSTTYQTVRRALLATGTGYPDKDVEIFLQGSYGNDTNIFSESDVDVVIRLDSMYHYDFASEMPAAERSAFEAGTGAVTYGYTQFRVDVLKALRSAFGASIDEGPKAVRIKPNSARRSADVVVATQFRRYYRFQGSQNESFSEGICFWSGQTQIVNFPKQHSENCTAKHQATAGWFKPMVRILKNMRGRLVDIAAIEKGTAPSYFLEGLLYNVPNDKFGSSYGETFVAALTWILENDRTKFECANERYYLLRDDPVTWPPASGETFLTKVVELWNNWS
ncbi:MAG: nucleotidyltransferase [Vicinamibacterales bacterium]